LQVMKDLADGDAAVAGDLHGQSHFEPVDAALGIPAIWVGLPKLSATVFAVRRSHTATCARRARNLRRSELVSSGRKNRRMTLVSVG
jgi:hypothetical protein